MRYLVIAAGLAVPFFVFSPRSVEASGLSLGSNWQVGDGGTGLQVFNPSPSSCRKLDVQCPNQAVLYRPSGCPGTSPCAIIDAGVGDTVMDFSTSTGSSDPFPVTLSIARQEKTLVLYAVDGGVVSCNFHCIDP